MLTVLTTITFVILALATLFVADTFIKGNKSVVSKILGFLMLGGFICGFIYLFGASHFMSFNVKIKSLDSIKAFVYRLAIILLLLSMLLVLLTLTIRTVVHFVKQSEAKKIEKNQESLDSVVFDINTIPDNFNGNTTAIFRESINNNDGFSFCLEGGTR